MITKVGVLSSQLLSRQMMIRSFEADSRFSVVAEFGTCREAMVSAHCSEWNLLIIDVSDESGVDLTELQSIQQRHSSPRILLVAASSTVSIKFREMLKSGVQGILSREVSLELFLHVSLVVAEGGSYFDKKIVDLLSGDPSAEPKPPLSNRELQVLRFITSGYSTKEVATLLGLSVKTVEHHRARLMHKLEVHDVVRLTHFAIRTGIVPVQL